MNYLVMISFALLLMTVWSVRNPYIKKNYQYTCVYDCLVDEHCNNLCTEDGAKSGSGKWTTQHGNACWCIELPDNVSIPITVQNKCHHR
uniref:NaTxalpha-C5-3 n=1 Tax=Mesobuthus eupeus TaxID=34648 RepID=G4WFQ6_MESEU|nr:NaTxalpha-C5-3 [Mesobuthus eupeus]